MAETLHVSVPLLLDVSALNAAGAYRLDGRTREVSVYVRFGAGTTGGAVTVETAYDHTWSGTWAALTTITWAEANREHVVQMTGAIRAIRARVSTAIAGGTVSAWLVAN